MQTPTGIDISNYDSDKSSTGHGSSDNTDNPSSSSFTGGDAESGTGGSVQTKDLRDTIIKNEEKSVRKARCLVGFAVIACAIAVSVLVYVFAKKGDLKSFELQVSFRREYTCREPHHVNCVSTNALYVIGFPSTKGL